ncbi:MAG: dTMP kinase [Candidatus Pacearchaeota archaeon]
MKGKFIVFEGIDGSGEDTQLDLLYKKIKSLDKYQNILATHEPTGNATEIKRKLKHDNDAYSSGEEMALLFVEDRTQHSYEIIKPGLEKGIDVLCSRYKMSTCAFQQTQGIPLDKLLEIHEHRGILIPDLTFYLDVDGKIAEQRIHKRGEEIEKFEKIDFLDRVNLNYRNLYELSRLNKSLFGEVIKIDGNKSIHDVTEDIYQEFLNFYNKD